MSGITDRARPEILALKAYSHAAWEPQLVRMHANELPVRVDGDPSAAGLNRYPEPQPPELVRGFAGLCGVDPAQVLVGRGSDEAIDVLVRVFCRAGQDNVIVCPPTFGMYGVAARIQGADVRTVPLRADAGFDLDVAKILAAVDANTKIVFVCTPNNPTGNVVPRDVVLDLARHLAASGTLLCVDEAYLEFGTAPSVAGDVAAWPNLCVLKTLSKAHGLAGARCGALVADPAIIALGRKVIPPYAIAEMTVEIVAPLLAPAGLAAMRGRVAGILAERTRLVEGLRAARGVRKIWPTEANFVLVDFDDPDDVLRRVRSAGLIIRDVRQPLLPQALRISVGTPEQDDRLLEALK